MQYRLNDDLEYHDPTQPFTTMCPFLPGQTINILDVPQEIDGNKGRGYSDPAFSTQLATSTMDPDDKYLTPRPAPVPKLPRLATSSSSLQQHKDSFSPQKTGLLKLYSKSANSSPSTERPNPLERLLTSSRQPANSDYRCTKSSPTASYNALRSALTTLKHPRSAGPDFETERGRRAFFREERPMEIGEPVLVSRTDPGRHCIPITSSHSAPGSRSLSPSAGPGNLDPRPLMSHPVDMSRRSLTPVLKRQSVTRSRTPSPLRHAVVLEGCQVLDSAFESSKAPSTYKLPIENSSTHQQKRIKQDAAQSSRVVNAEAEIQAPPCQITVEALDKCLPDLPSYLRPEPLKLHPHISECGDGTKSRFSIYSTSTVESSPSLSFTSDDPKSPSFNSAFTKSDTSGSSNHFFPSPATPHFTDFSDGFGKDERAEYGTKDPLSEEANILEEYAAIPLEGLRIDSAGSRRDAACFGFQNFQGYSLPREEQDSQLTLCKASSPTHTASAFSNPSEQQANGAILPPWHGSSHQSLVTMEELYNDLGYLGAMIT